MLTKRILAGIYCLIKTLEASESSPFNSVDLVHEKILEVTVPQIPSLSYGLSQMTLEDRVSEEQKSSTELPKPSLSFFEISEQMDVLIKTISECDIKTAVEMIETRLVQILDSGAGLHDIALTIGSLPIDAKELVLTAVESKAHTLLKLLQIVYIWQDGQQYHWFMALSYGSLWYNKEVWGNLDSFPLDWKNNLRAICKVDNGNLAAMVLRDISTENALKDSGKELLLLSLEYDAINVFRVLKMDPIILKEHLESLARNGAVELLKLYQTCTGVAHLHLEEYPFPDILPTNVEDFKFLMKNGYNFLPMNHFIKRFCNEGRLDLLMHLHTTDPMLAPGKSDLEHAIKGGQTDIIKWAHQLNVISEDALTKYWVFTLAFGHFQVFEKELNGGKFTNEEVMFIYEFAISQAPDTKILETLKSIDKKYPIKDGSQKWANLAVERGIFPVLKWLYEKYKILPTTKCLANATPNMLDWIQSKDDTLINAELVIYGQSNTELLRWIFENVPRLIPAIREYASTSMVSSMEEMLWFNKNLGVCSFDMNWAYTIGDLEAIQWVKENCGIYPTVENSCSAAEGGHFYIINWMHKVSNTKSPPCFNLETLKTAIRYGNLGIADYLILHFPPEKRVFASIDDSVDAGQFLSVLKWAFEHKFDLNPPAKMLQAANRGDVKAIKWILETFTTLELTFTCWATLILGENLRLSKQLLKEYPNWRCRPDDLIEYFEKAFELGNLELVQAILEREPLLAETLSRLALTKNNYHVKQWLIENGKWHY